jgi:hypothetical protein
MVEKVDALVMTDPEQFLAYADAIAARATKYILTVQLRLTVREKRRLSPNPVIAFRSTF